MKGSTRISSFTLHSLLLIQKLDSFGLRPQNDVKNSLSTLIGQVCSTDSTSLVKAACKQSANPPLGFAPRSLCVAYELRSVGAIRSLSGFVRFAHFIRTQIRYTCISFSNPNNELTDSSS